eukprot:scaffold144747_cov21-Tisochrysis_lutea.AAC.2
MEFKHDSISKRGYGGMASREGRFKDKLRYTGPVSQWARVCPIIHAIMSGCVLVMHALHQFVVEHAGGGRTHVLSVCTDPVQSPLNAQLWVMTCEEVPNK